MSDEVRLLELLLFIGLNRRSGSRILMNLWLSLVGILLGGGGLGFLSSLLPFLVALGAHEVGVMAAVEGVAVGAQNLF